MQQAIHPFTPLCHFGTARTHYPHITHTHKHALSHPPPGHTAVLCSVSNIARVPWFTQRKKKRRLAVIQLQRYSIVILYVHTLSTVMWLGMPELLGCCAQVSKLPWKVSVIINQQRTSEKKIIFSPRLWLNTPSKCTSDGFSPHLTLTKFFTLLLSQV